MWKNFDGKPYNHDSLALHINSLDFSHWQRKDGSKGKPLYIVFHNTSEPTIKLWLSWPTEKRQQYIINVEHMYEVDDHWHAGPHFFVPPTDDPICFGFSDPTTAGTHASCFNSDSIGIEQVGEFNDEDYNSGPGLIVQNNTIYLAALLYRKIGLTPSETTLKFHIECKADNHDCPGTSARDKATLIKKIAAKIWQLDGPSLSIAAAPSAVPAPAVPAPAVPVLQNLVTAIMTMFAGKDDPENSAYTGKRIDATKVGFSLPYHFPDPKPWIRVHANNKTCDGPLVDVGPGATHDKYWETNTKPIAHNGAGLDATDAVWNALDIHDDRRGKIQVQWKFITAP